MRNFTEPEGVLHTHSLNDGKFMQHSTLIVQREIDFEVWYIVLAHGQSVCLADFLVYLREREREMMMMMMMMMINNTHHDY